MINTVRNYTVLCAFVLIAFLLILLMPQLLAATSIFGKSVNGETVAVTCVDEGGAETFLRGTEILFLNVLKENGFNIFDKERLDELRKDALVKAWLLHKGQHMLDEIARKYDTDILICGFLKTGSEHGISSYWVGTAHLEVKVGSRRNAEVVEAIMSDPMGIPGYPGSLAVTEISAKDIAIKKSVVNVLGKMGVRNIPSYPDEPLEISLQQGTCTSSDIPHLEGDIDKEILKIVSQDTETWKRKNITCSALSQDKRVAAIGILTVDIDLQRHLRIDTPSIKLFDVDRRKELRTLEIPSDGKRYKSKKNTACAFGPNWRFLAVATEHPKLFVWDTETGNILTWTPLTDIPQFIGFTDGGDCIIVKTKGKENIAFQIKSRTNF